MHLVEQGGFGYLLKDRVLDVEEFLCAAERVAKGGSALDPHVVGRMVGRSTVPGLDELTEREREVLQLMAEGLANAGIAKRVHLSGRTIETYVGHLMLKLDLVETEDINRRVLAVLAHDG